MEHRDPSKGPPKERGPTLDKLSMLDEHGSKRTIYPAEVHGRWARWRPIIHYVLIAIYVALPFIEIGGHPAVWIDIGNRHFYLFGATFNAQDFYLAFFIFTAIGFSLIVAAALFGRVWCGFACPQTVFLESVFRKIERLFEGKAAERRRLASAPWTVDKILRKTGKHLVYLAMATTIAHVFLAYFASADRLGQMIVEGPGAHMGTFIWALVLTLIFYGNFWWFREQLCIVICPYGRLQSALQDQDTLNVIYDKARGEPRGKAKEKDRAKAAGAALGDCVDCFRCVAVCPTGIDIRNGHQLECIGCTACIDACDDVMTKLERPRGLIRYDSLRAVETGKHRFWRPRVYFYSFMGLLGLVVATAVIMANDPFEAEPLRTGTPFSIVEGTVVNQVRVHVVNKQGQPATYRIAASPAHPDDARFVTLPQPEVHLEPFADHDLPVIIRIPGADWVRGRIVHLEVTSSFGDLKKEVEVKVLGPNRLAVPP